MSSQKSQKSLLPNVSVVVNLHHEGRLAHPSLKSVVRSIEFYKAQSKGSECEVVVVADCPSLETKDYLRAFAKRVVTTDLSIHYTEFSDVSLSRNLGIDKAEYEYVAVLSGDDLMCENWLNMAIKVIIESPNDVIVHPEYIFTFDGKSELRQIIASTNKLFNPRLTLELDPFPSLMMAKKIVLESNRFRESGSQSTPNHSSWLWNLDTLAKGIPHEVVKKTVLAKRYGEKWLKPDPGYYPVLQHSDYLSNISPREHLGTNHDPKETDRRDRNLRFARNTVEGLYNSRLLKKLGSKKPRLDTYLTSLRNETLHLLRPIDREANPPIPNWVIKEVWGLNNIDLQIFFADFIEKGMVHYKPEESNFTKAYWDLKERISKSVDYLFLVPFIKNGGAEREIANNINAVLKFKPSARIKVLATEDSDSPWASNLNAKVDFIEPSRDFFNLSFEEQGRLIANLCIQLEPKKIHVVNSFPAYLSLQNYSPAIARSSEIYITIFMIDRTDEGREAHALPERMLTSIDYVKKIFTDNQTVATRLSDLLAINKDKFSVHYQPLDPDQKISTQTAENKFNHKKIKVMWAGRIDRQKRPDILLQIAKAIKTNQLDVEIDVYGSPVFKDLKYLEDIKSSDIVNYHGGYEGGLKSLPVDEFDIFLMTSEWEGMPNVLIEAILGGMLVIAPNVGGVAELINDGVTGYIINDFSDIKSYIDAIEKAVSNPKLSRDIIKNAQDLVAKRHSQSSYKKRILGEKEYLN